MTTAKPVSLDLAELRDALEFVSVGGLCENSAYVSRDSGRIYCLSDVIEPDEDVPDDLEDSDRYLAIPHKADLDLGRNLALSFIDLELPIELAIVHRIFRHKGAYARFKELLALRGLLDKWYDYEDHATEQALRRWCGENGIKLVGR